MEIIALVGVILIAIYEVICHEYEKREWKNERSELLNRIMAKSLPEYIEAEEKREGQKMKVISLEELKKELEPNQYEEGIPV